MVIGTTDKAIQDAGMVKDELKNSTVPGTGLDGKEGGAETKPEKTYRQSEVDALLGKAGQKIQAKLTDVTTERDTLKSQLETLTAEITEARESITSLTKDIEAMSEEDPDKHNLVKLRKAKEVELQALRTERAGIAPAKAEIAKWNRDQLVYTVADEFATTTGEDIDFDSFMTAADKFKLSGREELEALAETMGFKPKGETKEESPKSQIQAPKGYSGITEGGAMNYDNLSPREKIEAGLQEKAKRKK